MTGHRRTKVATRRWSRAASRFSAIWRIPARCRRCSRSRATSGSRSPVREEAIVALRFTARGKAGARVATALMELAERAPAELARAGAVHDGQPRDPEPAGRAAEEAGDRRRGRAGDAGDRAAGADRDARGRRCAGGRADGDAGPDARGGRRQRARRPSRRSARAGARAARGARRRARGAAGAAVAPAHPHAASRAARQGRSWRRRCSRTRWPASATVRPRTRCCRSRARSIATRRAAACARWRPSYRSARTATAR